jgi:hypothetical protein
MYWLHDTQFKTPLFDVPLTFKMKDLSRVTRERTFILLLHMDDEAKGSILLVFVAGLPCHDQEAGSHHTDLLRETSHICMVKEAGHVHIVFENT